MDDGKRVVVARLAGERHFSQIFVAVLGTSNFTYPQAIRTQKLADLTETLRMMSRSESLSVRAEPLSKLVF
jgi:hypothetical protein